MLWEIWCQKPCWSQGTQYSVPHPYLPRWSCHCRSVSGWSNMIHPGWTCWVLLTTSFSSTCLEMTSRLSWSITFPVTYVRAYWPSVSLVLLLAFLKISKEKQQTKRKQNPIQSKNSPWRKRCVFLSVCLFSSGSAAFKNTAIQEFWCPSGTSITEPL